MRAENQNYPGLNFIPGWFSWSHTAFFGRNVGATPNGRKAGEAISHGANPHPGFRRDGAVTAMANSIAAIQPGYGNTAPLQLEFDPQITIQEGGVDRVLELIRTPAEIYADSKLYLDIYILGVPFLLLYNVATGIFSALGDSRTPFWFLAASSLSNIFMDIFFVTAFRMGVAGVAWATFLCQGASCVLAVWVVFRRLRGLSPEQKGRAFSWPMLGRLARVAVPSMLQQGCISVGNIIIQGVINGFGTAVVAGYAAAIKLNNLVTTSFTTLGNGMSNFTAQNLGAEKPRRIRKGFAAGGTTCTAICAKKSAYFSVISEKTACILNGPVIK